VDDTEEEKGFLILQKRSGRQHDWYNLSRNRFFLLISEVVRHEREISNAGR
jgi:hypothetical protein